MKKFLAGLAVAGAFLGCAFGLTACDFLDDALGNGGNSDNSDNSGSTVEPDKPDKPDTGNQGGGSSGSQEDFSCSHGGALYEVIRYEEPTCSQDGRSLNVYVCTNNIKDGTGKEIMCGAVFANKNSTEQLGQVQGLTANVFFSMIEAGRIDSLSPYFDTYMATLPKASHTPVTDEAVEATCFATGLTEGSHCEVCNTVLTEQQTVPKSNHKFTDKFEFGETTYDVCKSCGKLNGTEYYLNVKFKDDTNSYTVTGIDGDWQRLDFNEFKSYNGKPINEIDRRAFSENKTIRYANIGGDITIMGGGAFNGCTALEEVVIGNGITTLERETFAWCPKLKKVTVADSVTDIKTTPTFSGYVSPFEDCPIETACVSSKLLPYINNDSLKTLYVTSGWLDDYNTNESCLSGCSSLTDLTIGIGVTSIGFFAFGGCTNLTNLTIYSGVEKINTYAFGNCGSIIRINFEGTIEQWNAIVKASKSDWDENTGEYTVKCTDGLLDKSGNLIEE